MSCEGFQSGYITIMTTRNNFWSFHIENVLFKEFSRYFASCWKIFQSKKIKIGKNIKDSL